MRVNDFAPGRKQWNKKRKIMRILFSLLALILSISALSLSSYAWFGMSAKSGENVIITVDYAVTATLNSGEPQTALMSEGAGVSFDLTPGAQTLVLNAPASDASHRYAVNGFALLTFTYTDAGSAGHSDTYYKTLTSATDTTVTFTISAVTNAHLSVSAHWGAPASFASVTAAAMPDDLVLLPTSEEPAGVVSNADVDASGGVEFVSDTAPAEDKQTTVSITSLDGVNEGDTLSLNVVTTDLSQASVNDAFVVSEEQTAVAGISLSLVNASKQTVTFDGGEATVTTFILPGLDQDHISVIYNGSGAAPTFVSYDSATGELIFTTTHFSEYYIVYEGEWYYLEANGRAYTNFDDMNDAILLIAEEAIADQIDKLNVEQIIAGYEYIGSDYDAHYAILHYLMSGMDGFTEEWLSFTNDEDQTFAYTVDGTTIADLQGMAEAYSAALNASYVIYPELTEGVYGGGGIMFEEPYEN